MLCARSNLELQFHSVVRKLHVVRKSCVRLFVRQIMTNMSEERAPGLQPLHGFHRVLYRRMRRVRLMTQRVEKEHIQVLQPGQRLFGDLAMIGEISSGTKAKTENFGVTVDKDDWLETSSEKLNRPVDRLQFNLGKSAELIFGVENISKHPANKFDRVGMRVQRQLVWLVKKTQWAKIVNSKQMVCVSMRIEHGVEAANIFTDRLLAEVGCGIDQHSAAAVFNEYGGPSAQVAGIGGMTNGAITANGGHTHGRAAPQDGERSLHFAAGTCCGPLAMALVTST